MFYKYDITSNCPNRKLPKQTTYLHLAAGVCSSDFFNLYLDTNGIDINVQNDFGRNTVDDCLQIQ